MCERRIFKFFSKISEHNRLNLWEAKLKLSITVATRFIEGDKTAIEEVYLLSQDLLYFLIATYVKRREDVEDVYQETYVKILENRQEVHDPSHLQNYLCSTARNCAIDFARKSSQKDQGEDDETLLENVGANDEENTVIDELEANLSHQETAVVYYRIVFALQWDEISTLTGIPNSSARLLYRQAVKKLRKKERMSMFNKAIYRQKSLAKLHSFVPEATIMASYQTGERPQHKTNHRIGLIWGLGLGSVTLLTVIGFGVGYGVKVADDHCFTNASKTQALMITVSVYGII